MSSECYSKLSWANVDGLSAEDKTALLSVVEQATLANGRRSITAPDDVILKCQVVGTCQCDLLGISPSKMNYAAALAEVAGAHWDED